MSAGTLRAPMGKKKTTGEEPAEQPEKKTTMKVAPDLLRKAKMVATYLDKDMFEFVDGILRPAVEEMYDQMIRDESKGKGAK